MRPAAEPIALVSAEQPGFARPSPLFVTRPRPVASFHDSDRLAGIGLYGVRADPIDYLGMCREPNVAALARMANEFFQYPDT